MFKDIMTIYRYESDDTYSKQIVSGVYFVEKTGVTPSGNGVTYNKGVNVITSPETTSRYGEWTVKPKDKIIKGEGKDITTAKGLNGYTVMSVDFNIANCPLDNIVIVGA